MFCLRICAALAIWLALGATCLFSQTSLSPSDAVKKFRDQGGRFEQVPLFFPLAQRNAVAASFAPNAQFLTLDPDLRHLENQNLPNALSLRLPYNGEVLVLDLLEAPVFTTDFRATTNLSDEQAVDYQPSRHYRGVIRDAAKSIVAISFCKSGIMGLIADEQHGNLVLGKLDSPENETDYILYADHELTAKNPFSCSPLEIENPGTKTPATGSLEQSPCVRVYFEADYELFQNKGSVQNTVDYLSGAFNQLATLYANEQISTTLSQVYVWTTPDNYSTSSSNSALQGFRALRQSFNGDIAHLVGIGGNNLGGIAYVDVLCAPAYAYAFSDINTSYSTVPTYSWTVEVLTHEMGHNLGSPHTQSCSWPGGAIDNCFTTEGGCSPGPAPVNGGTIMSYCHLSGAGINFNHGFGPLPGNKIRTEVASASCLSSACAPAGSCTAPSGITVSNVTANSALLSWTNVSGASGYILQWRVNGAPNWTTVTAPSNPYSLVGLSPNQTIESRLQSQCGSSTSSYSYGPIFTTSGGGSGTTCGPLENLGATLTSPTTAVISWKSVSGAVSYQLYFKTASSGSWGAPVTLGNTSYPLNNLAPKTKYELRVSANCSNTSSAFTQISFTTPSGGGTAACGLPGNFSAAPSSPNTANISWNAVSGAQYYQLWYKPANSYYYSSSIYVSGSSYILTGLAENTAYHVRIRAVCSANKSAYQTILFTTPGTGGPGGICPTPTNLVLNSVGANSAVISWNPMPDAQSYDLQIKLSTSTYWMTFINLPATVIQVTNMQASSTYQVKVRTRCSGSNNYSEYTNILNINTPANFSPGEVNDAFPPTGNEQVRLPDVAASNEHLGNLEIFPNPATGRTRVLFPAATETEFDLEMLDLNGRLLQIEFSKLSDGSAEVDLSGLPAGIYLLRATATGALPMLGRVIKQ